MEFNTVNYLRLPMNNSVACEQPAYCATVLPGWDTNCKTKATCEGVLVSVNEGKVQEALWQYDKNKDHILGPDDVLDAPLIRDYGIESVDLLPTTTRRIAELFIATQLLVGTNRFFSSPDDVIRFAKASHEIDKTYADIQWLKMLPTESDAEVTKGTALFSDKYWMQIKERFGEMGVRSAWAVFDDLKYIAALNMGSVGAIRPRDKAEAQKDPSLGKHYYRVMPWGMPFGIQQQFVDMTRKLTEIIAYAERTPSIHCVGVACPEENKTYSLTSTAGVAVLFQRDTHGLNALYDTTYGSATLITVRGPGAWGMIEVQGEDGEPHFESFVSQKGLLDHKAMMTALAPKQASLF